MIHWDEGQVYPLRKQAIRWLYNETDRPLELLVTCVDTLFRRPVTANNNVGQIEDRLPARVGNK